MAEPISWGQKMMRLPYSVLGYELDSEKEWADKQRQEEILKRLAENNTLVDPRLQADVGAYKRGELDHIKSPYHWRGVMAPGAPMYNAMEWFSSVPRMAVAGSQRLANWVDPEATPYPKAKQQFDSALNTATMYGAEAAGMVPKGTPTVVDVAETARERRGQRPEGIAPGMWDDVVSHLASQEADDLSVDAAESLKSAGVPETPAAFWGAAMESVLDPYNGMGHAVKAARAGQAALRPLVMEFGTNQGFAGLPYTVPAVHGVLAPLLPEPQTDYRTKPGDYIRQY